ncbi:MAG TPA: aldo/keto reductase [Gammaproteobacteria bacterium]|jgi:aryl-alcohol dehydrogenase-like predicted oxidoreductase|nr:aldo/keto reductase [Gammaproteobacteria bacterium]
MTISRRDALKAGAGAAVALGASGGTGRLFAQSGNLIMKTIPASGETIAPVGIGTNRYGVGESEAERAPLRDTMARFVELGGSVMDTAQVYGTSEQVIGDLSNELSIRDRLFLVTKTDIRGQIVGTEGLQMAFEKLRTDMIDGFLVHNFANTASELAVMREWQAEGKIRYIGASTSSDNQHGDMVNLLNTENVQLIQINYSLGDRESAERVLPLAADKGAAVMINVPFGGGRTNSLFNVVEGVDLPEWAADFGALSWAQFFLKYIVSHPSVTVAIPGTRSVDHVNDNFGAAMGRLPDAAERRRMEQFFDSL